MRAIGVILPIALALGVCGSTPPKPVRKLPTTVAAFFAAKSATCAEAPADLARDDGLHDGPPLAIDPAMRDLVSASRTVITVQSVSGRPICIPLSWIDTVEEFYLSDDKRLVDFDHSGVEDWGHFLVDRRSGQVIETGTQPESSEDGTMLVAVPPERHDEGGIDSIGLWQVLPERIVTRAMLDPPDAESWRVERWVGNNCAELSAVRSADYWGPDIDGGDDEAAERAIAKLPRLYFRVRSAGGKWRIEPTHDARPCSHLPGSGTTSA